MPINLNMGGVNEPVPEGTYVFRIADAEIGKSKQNSDQLVIKLVICQPAEQVDRVVMDFIPIMESTLWRLQLFLNAATGKDWSEDNMELDEKDLIGLFVRGTTFIDEYQGQKRAKVREYFEDIEYPSSPESNPFADRNDDQQEPF